MKLSRRSFLQIAAASGAVAFLPRRAWADGTVLDGQLPIEISVPGKYVLTSNQTVNLGGTPAIQVKTDHVEIDLQGFRIENTAGPGNGSIGILGVNCSNLFVHHGIVKGFYAGVFLEDTTGTTRGHRLDQITSDHCTALGFMLSGNGCVISNNTVESPGGSTLFAAYSACSAAMGIAIVRSFGMVIRGNSIQIADGGVGRGTVGIFANGLAENLIVLSNTITGADHGIVFDERAGATGQYRDNTVKSPYITPYAGGYDIGNNTSVVL